jgi:hypothetical protein
MADPYYRNLFAYIPAYAICRDTMIRDDDDDESNDYQQSDIVPLLCSLKYFPERAVSTPFNDNFKEEIRWIMGSHLNDYLRIQEGYKLSRKESRMNKYK